MAKIEKREFKLHKDILWSIIQSQAGTLGKAILELVMNSIDAGASSVNIKIDSKLVEVSDDGKGFADRKEIEAFFETFGTPHKEGDATYGRFRMGRGQIMAFSRNIWKSGTFEMDVNIRDDGLNYKLSSVNSAFKGCSIRAELYDLMKPSETIQLTDSVTQLCRYAPVPVYVNDARVSLELETEKWSFKDDNAYYNFRRGKDLEVYNLGVLVRSYPSEQFGIGGIVVSKKQLNVNFARNDILVSKCPVWKDIAKVIKAEANKINDKKPVQDEAWRACTMAKISIADYETTTEYVDALEKHKVFTDVSGKHYSFMQLADSISEYCSKIVVDQTMFDTLIADKIHQYKLGLVLSQSTFNRFGQLKFGTLVERVISNLTALNNSVPYFESYSPYGTRRIAQIIESLNNLINAQTPYRDLKDAIDETCVMVDRKDLTKDELCTLAAVIRMSDLMRWGLKLSTRNIRICESETMDGFTDGDTFIAIERKFLKINGNSPTTSFERIKYLLLHEYCHDSEDSTGHSHSAEFYEKFHNYLIDDPYGYLQNLAITGCSVWINERKKKGLKIAHNVLKAVDIYSAVVEEEEIETELKIAAKPKNQKDNKNA